MASRVECSLLHSALRASGLGLLLSFPALSFVLAPALASAWTSILPLLHRPDDTADPTGGCRCCLSATRSLTCAAAESIARDSPLAYRWPRLPVIACLLFYRARSRPTRHPTGLRPCDLPFRVAGSDTLTGQWQTHDEPMLE